jgi:multisubunit Na+/H+ antiporter MnhB subunit
VGAFVEATPGADFAVNGALVVVATLVLTIFKADLAAEEGILGGTRTVLGTSLARLRAGRPFGPAEVGAVGKAAGCSDHLVVFAVQTVLGAVVAVAVLANLAGRASLTTVEGAGQRTVADLGGNELVSSILPVLVTTDGEGGVLLVGIAVVGLDGFAQL